MLIQCTKKLLNELSMKPGEPIKEDTLFCWHANLIRANRRKTLVMVNDKNRYVLVLHGLKARDLKNLDKLIVQAIREAFQDECIDNDVIEQFLNHSSGIAYAKTKNRSLVARMNKACEIIDFYEYLLNEDSIIQNAVSVKASRYLVGGGNYKYPNREMYKNLEDFAGRPVLACKAAELKVTLNLDKHRVWRRLVIPIHMTFEKLHNALQVIFGWEDYHLHEFFIFGEEKFNNESLINHPGYHKEGYKPIANLVCNEEAFDYEDDIPIKLETGIKLVEYIPAKMKYIYDFGDNWQHYIEVENVKNYDKNYPVCLEGDGTTPPEDVGGEPGYEAFLKIIGDKNNPEHEDMVEWGESQGYKNFDIKMVNIRLK